jgi:hypothetical protein
MSDFDDEHPGTEKDDRPIPSTHTPEVDGWAVHVVRHEGESYPYTTIFSVGVQHFEIARGAADDPYAEEHCDWFRAMFVKALESRDRLVSASAPTWMVTRETSARYLGAYEWVRNPEKAAHFVTLEAAEAAATLARESNGGVTVEPSSSANMALIAEVLAELARARAKFPRPQASAHEGYAVLAEEVDELWDEIKGHNTQRRAPHARRGNPGRSDGAALHRRGLRPMSCGDDNDALNRRPSNAQPSVTVRDMGGDGLGPWRRFLGEHGVATWPHAAAALLSRAYAEEVAKCVRRALVAPAEQRCQVCDPEPGIAITHRPHCALRTGSAQSSWHGPCDKGCPETLGTSAAPMCESCETRPAATWCAGCLAEDREAAVIADGLSKGLDDDPLEACVRLFDEVCRWLDTNGLEGSAKVLHDVRGTFLLPRAAAPCASPSDAARGRAFIGEPGPRQAVPAPDPKSSPARLDTDRNAKPLTRLVATKDVPREGTSAHCATVPHADTYVADDGSRIPLGAAPSSGAGSDAMPGKITSGSRVVTAQDPTRIGEVRSIFVEAGVAWVVVRWEPTMRDVACDPAVLWLADQFTSPATKEKP